MWKGAVTDSNVAAQQEGLSALCAFLKYGGSQACSRFVDAWIQVGIVQMGLMGTQISQCYNTSYSRKGTAVSESRSEAELLGSVTTLH